jgi:HAE1 family hydrophobic/amphiphilic exporter-1
VSRFFISRPIFASSLAILMLVVGGLSMFSLPIALFPSIVPPTVQVTAGYPGSSAEVVSRVITTPLEQQINGVEGMIYMSSNSTANGAAAITVTFDVGYDIDIGAVDIQNMVQTALGQLPEVTQRSGVSIKKAQTDVTLFVTLSGKDAGYDGAFLGNWAEINMVNDLARIPGVGQVTNYGLQDYSVRIWLDPDRMSELEITPNDVVNAIENQNLDIAAGMIGAPPVPQAVPYTYQLKTMGQLRSVEQFEDIVVKVGDDGSMVQVKDIGRAELGASSYTSSATYQNRPAALIGIFQRPDSNAMEVANGVREYLEKMKNADRFPDGTEAIVAYDSTVFVKNNMNELFVTLLEAIGLVVLVVFMFLQSWRTTLIPIIAIPVSLVATFAVLAAFGFSINTLTLLGLVLAVGLVVDDAIVVVENVERQLEKGLARKDAALAAMKEVTPPIVATTVVLMAVFVPTAFTPGIAGQLYNQFALTIAFSVGLSAINSLSLSPALCGVLLKHTSREDRAKPFRMFNNGFDSVSSGFGRLVGVMSRRLWPVVLVVFGILLFATFDRVKATPTGFVPSEDQGWFFNFVALPSGSSLDRTETVCEEIAAKLLDTPGVSSVEVVSGYDFIDGYADMSTGVVFAILDDWEERSVHPDQQIPALLEVCKKQFASMEAAVVIPINPPPIPGLGSTGGFEYEVQDLLGRGTDELLKATLGFIEKCEARPEIGRLLCDLRTDYPQIELDIDRIEAQRLGASMGDVFQTLQVHLAGFYVNNWNKYGQVYEVNLQAEGSDRMTLDDVLALRVNSRFGGSIPLRQFVELQEVSGPVNIQHYNLYESAQVLGGPAKGFSGGQAVKALMEVSKTELIDKGWGGVWTGTVYQQLKAGSASIAIFGFSLIIVFLVLAALYESWSMPFIILLSVPLAVLGAVLALQIRGIPLDVYGQIGLLMLVGLAAKNAILIVEFAKGLREEGRGIIESAMEAARLRLRPILMTAFAFILGVLPLVFATGPGANARHSIGTPVLGGMIASTILSLLFVPVLYVIFEVVRERFAGSPPADDPKQESSPTPAI